MKSELDILEEILPQLRKYMNTVSTPTVEGFSLYLQANHTTPAKKSLEKGQSATALMKAYNNEGATLAFHLGRLGKYAKYYVKVAFEKFELINSDDFGFLAALMEHKTMGKSELIAYNVHEVPSGMEVIKRLLNKGLISEKVNPNDRRVKNLSPTPLGMEVFFKATKKMEAIAQIIKGRLSSEELKSLNALLEHLDDFHETIYTEQSEYDLEQIRETYLK